MSLDQRRVSEMTEMTKLAMNDAEDGPWKSEPHRVEFEHHGLPCLITRNHSTLTLCGYVGVPPTHPFHGRGIEDEGVDDLRVHGGVTFADACGGHICHTPKPGEPDEMWWLGFDCCHAFDLMPACPMNLADIKYRDIDYVKKRVISLADQLVEAAW